MTRRLSLHGTVLVLLAIGGVQFAGAQPVEAPGDVSISVPGDVDSVASNETRLVHAGDTLTLETGPGQPIRGRTDLRPGAVVTVRVQSADDDVPYLQTTSATVGADGTFHAVFDLSGFPAGTPLSVVVHRDGENLTRATGEVAACSSCSTAMPTTPSAVVVHDGGRLTVHSDPGQVVWARTNLPPGSTVNVRLRSSSGSSPFMKSVETTVDENGTARAVFDFDQVVPETAFSVAVRYNGTELTTARGRVACDGGCEGTASPTDQAMFAGAEVGVVQAANGSVARVRLRLGDADAALLTVNAPSSSYVLRASITDGDDDGEVVVLFNTTAAGRNGTTLAAAGDADGVGVRDETGRFGATDYRLVLHPPDNESVDVATGLLVVTQGDAADTPLLTSSPGPNGKFPVVSAAAILGGGAIAVVGLGMVLGLVDPRALFDRL